MTPPAVYWPPFGLVLTTPRLVLRPIRDDDIPAAVGAALSGIHEPGRSPFSFPWTDAPEGQLPANTAQHIWQLRAAFGPDSWCLQLGIWHGDDFLGCQDFGARNFSVLKTVATGSWLKQSAQGQGFGKEMRAAVVSYAFDHLKAEAAESDAADWNQQSLGVSRALGYEPNGIFRDTWTGGKVTTIQRLRLTPESFIRPDWDLDVEGHKELANFLRL